MIHIKTSAGGLLTTVSDTVRIIGIAMTSLNVDFLGQDRGSCQTNSQAQDSREFHNGERVVKVKKRRERKSDFMISRFSNPSFITFLALEFQIQNYLR
jgi:hypothetical protein